MKTSANRPVETRLSIPLPGGDSVSAVLQLADATVADSDLLILAHGAGQDMDSLFMQAVADSLAAPTLSVLRFNFQYMQAATDSGHRRVPDRAPKLEQCWREVADYARQTWSAKRLLLGGKSMGGRMATRIAANGYQCDGLVLLGYPLHPPGKPDKRRASRLTAITCPMLFIQGTRDSLCRLELLEPILAALPAARLHRIEGGDHSYQLLKRLQRGEAEMFTEVATAIEDWRHALP